MKIALYQGISLQSLAIRFLTRSPYSHAALVARDGRVYEAWDTGFRCTPSLSRQHTPGTRVDLFRFSNPLTESQYRNAINAAEGFLGRPYDWKNVLRFISKRRGQANIELFCSEAVILIAVAAGRELFRLTKPWEVPPDWLARSVALEYEQTITTT